MVKHTSTTMIQYSLETNYINRIYKKRKRDLSPFFYAITFYSSNSLTNDQN